MFTKGLYSCREKFVLRHYIKKADTKLQIQYHLHFIVLSNETNLSTQKQDDLSKPGDKDANMLNGGGAMSSLSNFSMFP